MFVKRIVKDLEFLNAENYPWRNCAGLLLPLKTALLSATSVSWDTNAIPCSRLHCSVSVRNGMPFK